MYYQWHIPEEASVNNVKAKSRRSRQSCFSTLYLPFALAAAGIPFYLMILLKLIELAQ